MKTFDQMASLPEIFARYEALGFWICPVKPNSKKPFSDPARSGTNSAEKMQKLAEKYPGCNWGILPSKSGLVVVDVDTRDGGFELWAEISHGLDIKTMKQKSARGGLHLLFKARPGSHYKKPFTSNGIDTQFNNIIVCYPSTIDGAQYHWVDESTIVDLPQKLETLFIAKHKSDNEPIEIPGIDVWIEQIVEQLRNKQVGYDEWLKIGMAIHSSLPNEDGLALWQRFSTGVNFKEGDVESCEYKWGGFSTGGGTTARSLGFIARDHGIEPPNFTLEQDKLLFASEYEKMELEAKNNPGWFDENGSWVCVHEKFVIDDLNAQGFFMENEENLGKVGKLVVEPDGYRKIKFHLPQNLRVGLAPYKFKWYTSKFTAKYTPAAKVWLESNKHQQYDRVIFAPQDEPGCLNLWSPLPVKPCKGDVSLFTKLVIEGIAADDISKGAWLMQWLAHLVQRPHERCSLVPVLLGDQGTGKGMLFDRIMKKLLGQFHYKIMTAQTLKERFNVDQAYRFLTFIDEATWRGDKTEDGILKSLTGSHQMTIEYKQGARLSVNNYSRYAIASNNPEAVSIERSNRRYVVFEVDPSFAHKHEFFHLLANNLDNGDLCANIMGYLMSVDISKFNPQKMPQFNDGQGHQAKISSEGVEAEFWNSVFNHHGQELWWDEDNLLKKHTYERFLRYAKDTNTWRKGLTDENFWRKTRSFFCLTQQGRERLPRELNRLDIVKINVNLARQRFGETLKLKMENDFEPKELILSDQNAHLRGEFSDFN